MSWAKLDDGFYDHPKVLAAGLAATGLFCRALAYASAKLTDGTIHVRVARFLSDGNDELAERLVEVGLWDRCEDGFVIHDFHDYNPAARKVKRARMTEAKRLREYRKRTAKRTAVRTGNVPPASNGPVPSPDLLRTHEDTPGSSAPAELPDPRPTTEVDPAPLPAGTVVRPEAQGSLPALPERRAAARVRRGQVPLPPALEASCPLDVAAWAKRELGWTDRHVAFWHEEFVEAVKRGAVKLGADPIASLKARFRRQFGKPVPGAAPASAPAAARPTQPNGDPYPEPPWSNRSRRVGGAP